MDTHELYGLPLDRFVPERGGLAKALRGDGRREEAAEVAEVAGLRTPSVAAWAVKRVVETLHAAALGEGAREQVRAGRVERELRHVGIGGIGGAAVVAEETLATAREEAAAAAAEAHRRAQEALREV